MNMSDLPLDLTWWALPGSLVTFGATFGLMPGLMLRLIVLLYPKGHPRREELFGELYDPEMGRIERFEWVFQQLETASREGLRARKHQRRNKKIESDRIDLADEVDLLAPPDKVRKVPPGVRMKTFPVAARKSESDVRAKESFIWKHGQGEYRTSAYGEYE
jgi:hypothetical protein